MSLLSTRPILTLFPDEVADLLIFHLFHGRLVVLGSLTEELLLNEIDACFIDQHELVPLYEVVKAYPCPANPHSSRFLVHRQRQH